MRYVVFPHRQKTGFAPPSAIDASMGAMSICEGLTTMLADPEQLSELWRREDLATAAICVIAEHRSHRHSLVMLLRAFGLRAQPFQTSADFLHHLRKRHDPPPTCAIIDLYHLNQPPAACVNGVQALCSALPVLLLAGAGRSVHRQIVQARSRAVTVLVKPYDPPALLLALQGLLGTDAAS